MQSALHAIVRPSICLSYTGESVKNG